MKYALSILAVVALTGTASANGVDVNADSQSLSGAQAIINIEGSTVPQTVFEGSNVPNNTPSVSAPGSMHTAPCVIGRSTGISLPGFGFSNSNGRVENNCNSREETGFIAQLMNMPNGPAKQAAIYHACATDASLRATLVAMGACTTSTPAVDSSDTTPRRSDVTDSRPALEVTCERRDGNIVPIVTRRVADAYSTAEIQAVCRQ
jgi:hypothetical protein